MWLLTPFATASTQGDNQLGAANLLHKRREDIQMRNEMPISPFSFYLRQYICWVPKSGMRD